MLTRTLRLAGAALIAAVTLAPVAADAQYYGGGAPGYYEVGDHGRGRHRGFRGDRGDYDYARAGYGWQGRRGPPPQAYYGGRYYRGRPYRRCDRGTGGTILGAIAGGLLGDSVAGRGDRGTGAIVGAGVGALTGRAIDRNC